MAASLMKINSKIIEEAAKIGNLYLLKHFLKNNRMPKGALPKSVESGNIEVVQYILEQEGVDINSKDVLLFFLKFNLLF